MQDELFIKFVAKAIKAPSGHNKQPWKFFRQENGGIKIAPDYSQAVPETIDTENRELFISMGCAIENISIYAGDIGMSANVETTGDSCHITLTKSQQTRDNVLAQAIDSRQTNRFTYNGKQLEQSHIAELEKCGAHLYAINTPQFKKITEYVEMGNNIQMNDKAFKHELKDSIRYNNKEAEDSHNGLNFELLGIQHIPAAIRKSAIAIGLNAKIQNKTDIKKINSSSHVAVITGDDNIEAWINVGRKLQRFLLTAHSLGIACSYLNQPCEVRTLATMLVKDIKLNSMPQIILRLGYAPPAPYSLRRPIDSFLE